MPDSGIIDMTDPEALREALFPGREKESLCPTVQKAIKALAKDIEKVEKEEDESK